MPDSGNDGTPPSENANGDMAAAWESVYDARRRRRTVHDLVRRLRDLRVNDDFSQHIRESMEPREQDH